MAESNPLLQAALEYADRGWAVFPLHSIKEGRCTCGKENCEHPGKHPRTAHGRNDATTNKAVLREWWKKWPDANVSLATGADSGGLIVLDVDKKAGGLENLKKLGAKGNLPYTLSVFSGGGGQHYYLASKNGTKIRNMQNVAGLSGIEIRGFGGSIIAPPSRHISGESYVWKIGPQAGKVEPIPDWLLKILTANKERPASLQGGSYWANLWAGVAEHEGRNNRAAQLAGRLLGRGMAVEEVQAVLNLWNQQNQPPMSDRELMAAIHSINRAEASKPAAGAIVSAQWLLAQPQEEIKEIITKGILPEGAGLILTGEGGSGKSLLSLEMALRISKGMPIWDFEIPEAKKVLIIQSENPMGQMKRRLDSIAYGLKISDLPNVHVIEPEFRADLNHERDRKKIKDRIEKVQAQVVILDPLVSYHSSNENDNGQMRRTLDNLTQISNEMSVSWIVVHHDAKPGEYKKDTKYTFRGASSIRDWARTMIGLQVKPNNEGRVLRQLHFNKINFGPEQTPILLERNQFWVHEVVEDATLSVVIECLAGIGGHCEGKAPLVKAISKTSGCSRRKAYQMIDEALGKGIDMLDESLYLTTKF